MNDTRRHLTDVEMTSCADDGEIEVGDVQDTGVRNPSKSHAPVVNHDVFARLCSISVTLTLALSKSAVSHRVVLS